MEHPLRSPSVPLLTALATLVLDLLGLAVLASLRFSPPRSGHSPNMGQAIFELLIVMFTALVTTAAGVAAAVQAWSERRRAWSVCLSVLLVIGPGVLLFWTVYQSGHTLRASELGAYQMMSIVGFGLLMTGVLLYHAVGRRGPPVWPIEPPI